MLWHESNVAIDLLLPVHGCRSTTVGQTSGRAPRCDDHQVKTEPFAVLATVLPSRTYRNDMETTYLWPLAGLAPAGPHPRIAAAPPNARPPQVFGPATVFPLPASWSAKVMRPVPPPGAASEAWYRMSRPSIW